MGRFSNSVPNFPLERLSKMSVQIIDILQVVGDNYEGVESEQSVLVGGLDSASVWSYLLIGLAGLAAVAFACCCYTVII